MLRVCVRVLVCVCVQRKHTIVRHEAHIRNVAKCCVVMPGNQGRRMLMEIPSKGKGQRKVLRIQRRQAPRRLASKGTARRGQAAVPRTKRREVPRRRTSTGTARKGRSEGQRAPHRMTTEAMVPVGTTHARVGSDSREEIEKEL